MLSEKHKFMYMGVAREMSRHEHNSCLSRHIGCVIVKHDMPGGRIISTGFNGPASGLPACDSEDHLRNMVIPQLTDDEYYKLERAACERAGMSEKTSVKGDRQFYGFVARKMDSCGQCPRKMIGAPSGTRLELCSCSHAERNAIVRSTESLQGCSIFCWCPLPCHECAIAIIQAGINTVYYLKTSGGDYSPSSRWMLTKAKVNLVEVHESFVPGSN